MLSYTEENYVKAIYHLCPAGNEAVSTNAIAETMQTKAASVTDMVRRLDQKGFVNYKRYQGVTISQEGKRKALQIIRKHRLWEVFLVEKLKFNWDEVHEVAEQLEHIKSPLLIKRLDEFLGFPKFDPHGDPIPDEDGVIQNKPMVALATLAPQQGGLVVSVKDSSSDFLRYLDKIGVYIGAKVKVMDRVAFDGSMEILLDQKRNLFVSAQVAENILVTE